MKNLKRIGLVVLILVILLLGAAFAIPYLFKDELVGKVKSLANEQIQDARIDFGDVHLSLFRHFPNLSLGLENLEVEGLGAFDGVRLAAAKELDLTFDLWSVLFTQKPISLRAIHLEQPGIHIYVLQNGRANYDIAKSDTTVVADTPNEPSGNDFNIQLEKLTVRDGQLRYDDRQGDVFAWIDGLNLQAAGAFTADQYDLDTELKVNALTLRQNGIAYLKKVRTQLKAVLDIDNRSQTYTLKETDLRLNLLRILAEGSIQLPDEERIVLDLNLRAPGNAFKELLSLIPNAYLEDYEAVKAEGNFALNADIDGTYHAATGAYPAFQVHLEVANGQVQYPDMPVGIADIQAEVDVNSPGSDLDRMQIDVRRLALKVSENPFRASLSLRTPISDPDVDADIEGVIDLKALSQAYPMEGITTLAGRIDANVQAKARLSAVEAGDYEQVDVQGQIRAREVLYRAEGMPPVQVSRMQLAFSPAYVALENTQAKLGKSDLSVEGRIDNILAYISPEKTMTGSLTLRSRFFDANEWMGTSEKPDEESQKVEALNAEAAMETDQVVFDRFDFSLDAECKRLAYRDYTLENAVARGQLNPNRLEVEKLGAQLGESDFSLAGKLTNLWNYLFGNGTLIGKAEFQSKRLNLNPFLADQAEGGEAPSAPEADELSPIVVPADLNLDLACRIDRLDYTDLVLRNLRGQVFVQNGMVVLNELTANTLGGQIGLSGNYDTANPVKPEFAMKLTLDRMDFQQSFDAFNTMQALAPIGRYMDGTFSTSLLMSAVLGPDLNPDLSTLDAEGFLHTLNAQVENFKPLVAVGNALQLDYLTEPIPISDTKNWFEVVDGRVEVKPFDIVLKDLTMNVSGFHGLNQEMDYKLKSKIPMEKLTGNAVGAVAAEGLEKLRREASRLGIQWQKQEFVNVAVGLKGSLDKPRVSVQLLGTEGERTLAEEAKAQAQEELEKQKERLRTEAEKKLEEGKQKAKEEVDKAVDSARTVAKEKVEEIKEQTKEKLKDELGDKAADVLGEEAQKQVDQILGDSSKSVEIIKEELDKWNPFKKKKKDN